jgi:hypothetical protein
VAKLRPWYQVVTPREDLRENRPLDASEFAVHLDHIRDKRSHEDYINPERLFERTYMTRNLLDLSSQVVRRRRKAEKGGGLDPPSEPCRMISACCSRWVSSNWVL